MSVKGKVGAPLVEGERVGRYVVLRDRDGQLHAVSLTGVGAMCETDDGVILLLPGGRMIHVCQSLAAVLAWVRREDCGMTRIRLTGAAIDRRKLYPAKRNIGLRHPAVNKSLSIKIGLLMTDPFGPGEPCNGS